MNQRRLRGALLLFLFATAGCHATTYSSVTLPDEQTKSENSCFAKCQARRSTGAENFIACVQSCPGATIYEDRECNDVQPVPNYFCTEEQMTRFSPVKTIFLLILVGAAAAAGGYAATHGLIPAK